MVKVTTVFFFFFILIEPSKVNNLNASRTKENSIEVNCKPPDQVNGPKGIYHLEVRIGTTSVKNYSKSECRFLLENLNYLTEYTFLVRLQFL